MRLTLGREEKVNAVRQVRCEAEARRQRVWVCAGDGMTEAKMPPGF